MNKAYCYYNFKKSYFPKKWASGLKKEDFFIKWWKWFPFDFPYLALCAIVRRGGEKRPPEHDCRNTFLPFQQNDKKVKQRMFFIPRKIFGFVIINTRNCFYWNSSLNCHSLIQRDILFLVVKTIFNCFVFLTSSCTNSFDCAAKCCSTSVQNAGCHIIFLEVRIRSKNCVFSLEKKFRFVYFKDQKPSSFLFSSDI